MLVGTLQKRLIRLVATGCPGAGRDQVGERRLSRATGSDDGDETRRKRDLRCGHPIGTGHGHAVDHPVVERTLGWMLGDDHALDWLKARLAKCFEGRVSLDPGVAILRGLA